MITTSNQQFHTHSVLIATGAQAIWLGLESEERLRGRGVSACATCDGLFFRNKVVAVVGGGDTALEDANTLSKVAKKVYILHRRDSFRASKVMQERIFVKDNIEILWNHEVKEVIGDQKVQSIRLWDNYIKKEKILDLDGVFVAIGHKPDTSIFKDKILLDEGDYVQTSMTVAIAKAKKPDIEVGSQFNFHYQTMTSVPGVFSGGDCVDHIYRQATTAVGSGVSASLDLERWLTDQDII